MADVYRCHMKMWRAGRIYRYVRIFSIRVNLRTILRVSASILMKNLAQIINLINIIVMILLIIAISVQNKSAGLSNVFGGGGSVTNSRRGVDKWLFYATIVLAILFVGLSITNLVIRVK